VPAIDNPNLAGNWGGEVHINVLRSGLYAGIHTGLKDNITMQIRQAGGMATLWIRQGHFGRICTTKASESTCPGFTVCANTWEIPLNASSCDATNFSRGVSTDAYRRLPVDPYMLDPERKIHMGSGAIHLTFRTHACTRNEYGEYRIDQHQRHWALWMDTAGPANTQYLEVRCVWQRKPEWAELFWFVVGSLNRC
jgi:hypothetical protein